MTASTLLLIAGPALFLAIHWLLERNRTDAVRKLAVRRGFTYLGRALPRSMTLEGTPFYQARSIWNIIEGKSLALRIVAFDCRIGAGKGSWRQTVIAAQSPDWPFGIARLDPTFTVARSGDWTFLFHPRTVSLFSKLTPIPELEDHLDGLALLFVSGLTRLN
jgi:hypothetical protein